MAVGTVSGLNLDEEWQLIATNSPSGATNSSFTSISGYKKLMVTYQISSASEKLVVRFNGDTGSNYAGIAIMYTTNQFRSNSTYIPITSYNEATPVGYTIFKNTDKTTTPKIVEDGGGFNVSVSKGIWFGTSAVTQLDIFAVDGTAFTGTLKLYGVAA